MNDQVSATFYDYLLLVVAYVQTHYWFYLGVPMRIFLRNEMWVASKLIRYIIVSFLLVLCTERLMIMNGNSAFMTLFVCLVFGFAGETPLRFFLDDFLQDFMIAVKDKIMKWVKK